MLADTVQKSLVAGVPPSALAAKVSLYGGVHHSLEHCSLRKKASGRLVKTSVPLKDLQAAHACSECDAFTYYDLRLGPYLRTLTSLTSALNLLKSPAPAPSVRAVSDIASARRMLRGCDIPAPLRNKVASTLKRCEARENELRDGIDNTKLESILLMQACVSTPLDGWVTRVGERMLDGESWDEAVQALACEERANVPKKLGPRQARMVKQHLAKTKLLYERELDLTTIVAVVSGFHKLKVVATHADIDEKSTAYVQYLRIRLALEPFCVIDNLLNAASNKVILTMPESVVRLCGTAPEILRIERIGQLHECDTRQTFKATLKLLDVMSSEDALATGRSLTHE